ncbi:MAG: hypothetical protein K2N73_06775 [Lachnospiraceae bacterium]|nr:hypothetical protein [Lachnospiraceae bacterium]
MKFIISVVLAIGVLLFSTQEGIALDTDVLYVFSIVMYGMPAMMVLVCGAIAFADSFCEDIEHKYIMQQVIRGDIERYVSARILSIFFVTMYSVTLAIFLFVCILHFKLAWVDVSGLQYNHIIHSGRLRFFLIHKWYSMYYFLYGIQYSVLAGILSLWAAYCSMYISNRMLVLSAPMIIYYFMDYILSGISSGMLNLSMIFSPSNNIFLNDFLSVLLVIIIAAINLFLIRKLLIKILRRKICE